MNEYRCGRVAINTDFDCKMLAPFQVSERHCDEEVFEISRMNAPKNLCSGWRCVASTDIASIFQCDSGDWAFKFRYRNMFAAVSGDYSRASYWIDGSMDEVASGYLLAMSLQPYFVTKGILILHAACIERDGVAFAFTADSGVGKSTRANQWIDLLDCGWVSGDRPCIDVRSGLLQSGPWDGKEQIFHNVVRSIGVIAEVRRSSTTWVRRMTSSQAFACLMKQLFVPMWDSALVMEVVLLARKLLRDYPLYWLFCDQTSQAALESYDILMRRQNEILKEAHDMKMNEGFIIRQELGEYMLMPIGEKIASFSGIVVLNETAAFILGKMANPICKDDLITLVCDEFEIDRETAKADLDCLLDKMASLGVVTL